MGDEAAATPLLREAVQGLTTVYSAEHQLVSTFQEFLDAVAEGFESEEEEEEEEETMYERMAKRRRRE